jgi:hypothetical protein
VRRAAGRIIFSHHGGVSARKNLRRAASHPRNNCVAAAAHDSAGIAIFAEPSTPENRSTIMS